MDVTKYLTPHKHGKAVLLPSGMEGHYDSMGVEGPHLFYHNGKYHLMHVGFDGNRYQTALAQSDDLIHWEFECMLMPREQSDTAWDRVGVACGWLLRENDLFGRPVPKKVDGRYWMSYNSYPNEGYEAGRASIGIAWTTDETLRTWTRRQEPVLRWEDGAPWEFCGLYKSCIVEHEGEFYMFYNAKDSEVWQWHEQIGVARSKDLLHWERYEGNPIVRNTPGAWDDKFCANANVYRDGDKWVMYYYGFDGEHARDGIAFSDDLLHWEKHPEPVLDIGAPGEIDEKHAHKPTVVYHDGTLYHFYAAVRLPQPGDTLKNLDPDKHFGNEHRCISVAYCSPRASEQ